MKESRVILVLLAIIILLGICLIFKIVNNTPEKQAQKMQEQIQNKTTSDASNSKDTSIKDIDLEESRKKSEKVWEGFGRLILRSKLKQATGKILTAFFVGLVYVISSCVIYKKLGINNILIWVNALLYIAGFGVIFTLNADLYQIITVLEGIVAIVLLILEMKSLEMNPYLLLLGFIPLVGMACIICLYIDLNCKLADRFHKGTGFKIGLIVLPIIFQPILACSAEE